MIITIVSILGLICMAILAHGVNRALSKSRDSVEIWLGWMIFGLSAALAGAVFGVSLFTGFGAEHPESGMSIGATALIGSWAYGFFKASEVSK